MNTIDTLIYNAITNFNNGIRFTLLFSLFIVKSKFTLYLFIITFISLLFNELLKQFGLCNPSSVAYGSFLICLSYLIYLSRTSKKIEQIILIGVPFCVTFGAKHYNIDSGDSLIIGTILGSLTAVIGYIMIYNSEYFDDFSNYVFQFL